MALDGSPSSVLGLLRYVDSIARYKAAVRAGETNTPAFAVKQSAMPIFTKKDVADGAVTARQTSTMSAAMVTLFRRSIFGGKPLRCLRAAGS